MVLEAIRYHPATASTAQALEIIDQLLLPHRTVFFSVNNCSDAHAAIRQMRVRGAPAIAIVAALALSVELGAIKKLPDDAGDVRLLIGERLDYLKTSRPTAVNLADATGKLKMVVKRATNEHNASGATVAARYVAAAEKMLSDDVADNEAIGSHGSTWIQQNTVAGKRRSIQGDSEFRILTHCNTGSLATAGYGTALGVIRSLHFADLLTHAYCSETRPYNQGSRLTAYELVHDHIPASLITDSMAASLLLREGDNIAAIVVGADRVAANGDTANKIGTYSLAVLARHHGVKFLVAAPRTTIDMSTSSGKEIVIEERSPIEVTRIKGPEIDGNGDLEIESDPVCISIAAAGISVWNPAFDVTPAALIDAIITEKGVVERSPGGTFDFRHLFDPPP